MHHEPDRLTGRAQIVRRAEPRPRNHRRQQERGRRRARHPSGTGWSAHRYARPRFAAGSWRHHKRSTTFRALAHELGTSSAALAHRYALSMVGVDTVVLGCKNRKEVLECVAAAEVGPLEPAIMARIDAAFAA